VNFYGGEPAVAELEYWILLTAGIFTIGVNRGSLRGARPLGLQWEWKNIFRTILAV